jgi:hypothetical protein
MRAGGLAEECKMLGSELLRKEHERLIEVTKACRLDMHEPDEQGISAVVTGWYLDNAHGAGPSSAEFAVGISNDDGCSYEWFNLASLIAMARAANRHKD